MRAEVARLRDASHPTGDPVDTAADSWLARVNLLKGRVQQTPGAKIPELQYLTDDDWLSAAKGDLKTDEDYKRAMSNLRNMAETALIQSQFQPALKLYAQANNGQFPTDLSQLQQYFTSPVDDSILQRWEIAPHSMVGGVGVGDNIITQIAAVDGDLDNRYAVGLNGWGTSGIQDWESPSLDTILAPVLKAYMAANNGLEPTDPSQVAPYITTPEQQAALQKVLKQAHNGFMAK